MNKTIKIFIFFLILQSSNLLTIESKAQEAGMKITKSDKIEVINGKKYYIHTVLKSQTLYSIAKTYSMSVDEIIKDNPEIKTAPIFPGQQLKISVKSQTADIKPQPIVPVKKDSFLSHTVRTKETLYSISKKYNVTEDEIRNANPDQNMNIQIGQIIKVPYKADALKDKDKEKKKSFIQGIFKKSEKSEVKKDTIAKVKPVKKADTTHVSVKKPETESGGCKEFIRSDVFNLAIILPLYLHETDAIQTEETENSKEDIKPSSAYKSFTYLQFYEGAMLALDSLKSLGLKSRVFVYDVYNDSTLVNKVLQKPEFASMNLILCPLIKQNHIGLLKFAEKHNIKLATYSHLKAENIKDFSQMFNLIPSEEEQQKQLGIYISSKFDNENIVIAYQGNNANEKKSADEMKQQLTQYLNKKNIKKEIGFIDLSKDGLSAMKEKLSSIDHNVIISYLRDEVLISGYIRYLNDLRQIFKVTLFGAQNWENLQNVEKDYLENLNLHLYSTNFIDYSDKNVKSFIYKFRKENKTEPNLYGYLGYDATFYFMNEMLRYGKNFDKCIQNNRSEMLENTYQFEKKENGYENIYLNIYKYQDFKLVNARKN